jgi:hypothetical protein
MKIAYAFKWVVYRQGDKKLQEIQINGVDIKIIPNIK